MTDVDRSTCTAHRHGTLSAYQRYACRCTDARDAAYLYYKHARNGQPYRRRIDATGSRRRVQALYAIGHTGDTIAAAAGLNPRHVQHVGSPKHRRYVTPATADAIAAAYDQLVTVPGSSVKTRQRAAWWGFLPPQWWADDIDDPTIDPLAEPDPAYVDAVLVDQVLAEQTPATALSPIERAAAARLGHRRGMPQSHLIRVLQMSGPTLADLTKEAA